MPGRGVFYGLCATGDCTNSGLTVRGIPGDPSMYESGDEMNQSHRCSKCRARINELLEAGLRIAEDAHGSLEPGTCGHRSFALYGREVLELNYSQLHD